MTQFTPDRKIIVQAVAQMAQGSFDYDRGVLAAIGQEQLAINYRADWHSAQSLCAQREALPETIFDTPHSAEYERLSNQLASANALMRASWAPIQALIDEARTELGMM